MNGLAQFYIEKLSRLRRQHLIDAPTFVAYMDAIIGSHKKRTAC